MSEHPFPDELPLRDWLQHQYEELLDAAIYCKKAIEDYDAQKFGG